MERLTQERVVLIMAGGAGTRFWPASRERLPKQFLDILGTGKTLLRHTFERCTRITTPDKIFIITNINYAERVLKELPELSPEQVFTEPSRNNTAPCIALATLKLRIRFPGSVCLVASSDHLISDVDTFVNIVQQGMRHAAANNVLVTLGITPSRPDTGYGYVHYDPTQSTDGMYPVIRFTEKPDLETAKRFLAEGGYLWNSGMFVWSLNAILEAFDQYASGIIDLLQPGTEVYFTDQEEAFLNEHYPKTEKTSIDYAILERADNVAVIPADFGWSDLGTWTALFDHLPADREGNVTVHQPVVIDKCKGSLIRTTDGKLVVASGLEDLVVVVEDDAVLIFPKDREQEIKQLREALREGGLDKYL
jgi:mannose-1-phosphate guanylyltransferase